MTRKERGWVQVKVRMQEELGRRLKERCAERGFTVVGAVRQMIELWVGEDVEQEEDTDDGTRIDYVGVHSGNWDSLH